MACRVLTGRRMADLSTQQDDNETPMIDEVREKLTDAAQRLTNKGEETVEKVRDAIRANPLAFVGGGIVAGYLIKTLFGSFTLTLAAISAGAYAATKRAAD